MLRPAVNRQPGFRRGLVEQSSAEKNTPVGWLADSLLARAVSAGLAWMAGSLMLTGRLAGKLAAGPLYKRLAG